MRPDMTQEFLQQATAAQPIAVITEGTRITRQHTDESEARVYHDAKHQITHTPGLTIADFNFKDVDRFRTFYQIAKETNKRMVISFKHACFLEQYHADPHLDVPHSTGDNIFLLKLKHRTGTYSDEDYTDDYIEDRLDYPNILTAEDIAKHPTEYLVVLNYWYFNTLVDLQPAQGLYIHSLSEPFNEEMELSYDRMQNWLTFFNLEFFQAHCSGHICGSELQHVLSTINPTTLFPIHTEHPEMFGNLAQTKVVEAGKTYSL
jgi:ribonuclease J